MRGFVSGVLWGAVVSGLGLATVSVLTPLAPPPDLARTAPDLARTVSGARQPELAGDSSVALAAPRTGPGVAPVARTAPVARDPAPDQSRGLSAEILAATGQPQVGTALRQPVGPAAETAPVALRADGRAGERMPRAAARPPVAPTPDRAPDRVAVVPEVAAPAGGTTDRNRTPAAVDSAVPVQAAPQDRTAPPAKAVPAAGADAPPAIADLPQAGINAAGPRPGLGTRVVPLTARRARAPAPGEQPLRKFAASFVAAADRPLLAIVLIDDPAFQDFGALKAFPHPLSIAVDPAAPGAAARMARYRTAGFEVMSLVDLPAGATAQDAEIALSAGFGTLHEAVAVLEGPGSGVQGNPDLARQVAEFVKGTGRGLVMQPGGLNTAYQLALRDRVPAALVFRDFDGAGQGSAAMRRSLDQAALRAGQQGAAVMQGRLRPETLRVLVSWGLQDHSARVALAPVSAVLLRAAAPD